MHLDALAAIAEANGDRAAGSAGYDASADYVAEQLAAMGYEVAREPVEFTSFRESAPVDLVIGRASWSGAEWLHAMIYSGSGNVAAVPEEVGTFGGRTTGCMAGHWDGFSDGGLALVTAGECPLRTKVLLAQDAGAVAVVVLFPSWAANHTLQPTLFDPRGIDIPAVVAGQEPATALIAAADNGTRVRLSVEVDRTPASDDNVVAELRGNRDTMVMIGGHLDSVIDGPGINDNGSGVSTILAIADALRTGPRPEITVRFALWAAEEFGLFGSRDFVINMSEDERARVRAYLNLDMVASPNAGLYVYEGTRASPRSSALTQMLLGALEDAGTPGMTIPAGGASDHYYFEQYLIPTGGVFSGIDPLRPDEAELFDGTAGLPADACYHLACDDRANVDVGTAAVLGDAVAAVLEELAY